MMEDYIINLIVVAVVSWTTLFMFIRWAFPKRSFDFCNRLVSTIHAVVAVGLASKSVVDWRRPVHPIASQSSHLQMQSLAITVGYLIYDLICCLFDKRVNIDNAVHHIVSIVGLGAGLYYQRVAFAVVFSLARMIGGPYLCYVTLSADNPFLIKAMALGLELVSVFWFLLS